MGQEIYLTGLLIPVDWYGNGNVKTVALATDDEKEISIGGPLQNNIMRHLRKQVALWGSFEDPTNQTVFQVRRFHPLQPPPE
jgi:hypothetical protein